MSELCSVVVSGIGAITAQGDFSIHSLNDGSVSGLSSVAGTGAIADFELSHYLASPKTYLDRCSALALAGCALALRDAGVANAKGSDADAIIDADRFGIMLGTHLGCLQTMRDFWDKAVERGSRLANPILFSHSYFNSPVSLCAIEWTLRGPHSTLCAGESSGLEAIRAAHASIALGHADAMLCGGVDAIGPMRNAGEPNNSGGEATVFFLLENAERAQQRGVKSVCALSDKDFGRAEQKMDAARSAFGPCGGATSALALLLALEGADV